MFEVKLITLMQPKDPPMLGSKDMLEAAAMLIKILSTWHNTTQGSQEAIIQHAKVWHTRYIRNKRLARSRTRNTL